MRSFIGLENMDSVDLHDWLSAYREDLRKWDRPNTGSKAQKWASRTCGRIVVILARRNYDPRTKKPPRCEFSAAFETHLPVAKEVQL